MKLQPARLIGSALDSLIGIVSPQLGFARQIVRAAMYAAAQSPRTLGGWSPVDSDINAIIKNSAVPVRARIRQLVRDFPYFARAANVLCDYTVGGGIVYQAAVRDKERNLAREINQQIEDAWNFWADEADASGRLHLYELMNLAKRQELESGEYLIVLRALKDKSRYLPLALQMYEPDWLSSMGAKTAPGNEVFEGVEYDPSTGRSIAYHFTDPSGKSKSFRIEAINVIHGFRTLRPSQLRGISDFTPGVMVAKDLSSYMDSEIDKVKMKSKWIGFIETNDIPGRQNGLQTDALGRKIDAMENAIIEYLRPGEKITLSSDSGSASNFPPMVKLILTMFSITSGVPYELLSGNYEGMSYSVGKMVRNDFTQSLRPTVTRHVRGFCEPVKRAFLESAVLSGRLKLKNFFANPAPYTRATWQPPGMESIDPSRETKSMIDQIKAGLRSPQEIAQARGRDLEEIYREISEAQAMADEMGIKLDLGAISTALKNNPAAIAEQDGKQPPAQGDNTDEETV